MLNWHQSMIRSGCAVALVLLAGSTISPALAKPFSLGSCSVTQTAPSPCVRGKTATGVAPGWNHDNCTTAKANAKKTLLSSMGGCTPNYVSCTDRCKNIEKQ